MPNLEKQLAKYDKQIASLSAKRAKIARSLIADAQSRLERLQRMAGESISPAVHKVPKASKGKRERRSPEELAKEAAQIINEIKSAGAEGLKGSAIKKTHSKVVNIKAFLKTHAPDASWSMKGKKAGSRYVAK
jgi:hypothetical protein